MMNYINIPNSISVFRVLLTFYGFWLFAQNGNQLTFLLITFASIILDGIDGIVARKLKQDTPFGAKMDIYSDRIVELSYWLFFWYLDLLGIWVFIFYLIRGLTVDYLSRKQEKPLGNSFLRSSRFMRFLYGGLKLLSFSMLIYVPTLIWAGIDWTQVVVCTTVLVCFLRAWPVYQDFFSKTN